MPSLRSFGRVVVFCGAGISAESGVPTYRGKGGTWNKYDWQEYACQEAFDRNPEKVWQFHEMRRNAVLDCEPNEAHKVLVEMEAELPEFTIVTQNIDGLHQRAGSKNVLELHGSLWRVRCEMEDKVLDFLDPIPVSYRCQCEAWLRPDIVWFGDSMREQVFTEALKAIQECQLLISVGTSGVVYPAAALPELAMQNGATMIEVNPEETAVSHLYEYVMRQPASVALRELWEAEDILDLGP